MADEIHKGSCACGLVSYEVTGKPILSAFCHCTLCQKHFSCPLVFTIHFHDSAFKWTHGQSTDAVCNTYFLRGTRYTCKKCGGYVAFLNPQGDEWSVWGAQLERDAQGKVKNLDTVKPTAHIFYDTRMLDVNDELGKWTGYEARSERI